MTPRCQPPQPEHPTEFYALDHEALQIAPQLQQNALAGEIDRRDLNAVPGAHKDEGVIRQPADRLMNRRAAEPGDFLQILDRQEPAGLELAVDDQVLDPLISQFEQVHAVLTARCHCRVLIHLVDFRARPFTASHACLPLCATRSA